MFQILILSVTATFWAKTLTTPARVEVTATWKGDLPAPTAGLRRWGPSPAMCLFASLLISDQTLATFDIWRTFLSYLWILLCSWSEALQFSLCFVIFFDKISISWDWKLLVIVKMDNRQCSIVFACLCGRDESGSRVNGSLGQAIQNLSMGQLGPGSNISFDCIN